MSGWARTVALGLSLVGIGGWANPVPVRSGSVPRLGDTPPALVVDDGVSRAGATGPFLGVIIPQDSADLSPRFESQLQEMDVEVGDTVQKGQVLARLDTRSLQQNLSAARATLQAAQAEVQAASLALSEARVKRKRYNTPRSLALGVYSQEELDGLRYRESTALARLESAQAQARERKAQVAELEQNLQEATLTAPFEGVIAARLIGPGSRVAAGQPVLRLLGRRGWKVRFALPEGAARQLYEGAPVQLWVVQQGASLTGTVESIAPEVDTAARLVFAIATFNQPPADNVSTGQVVHVRAEAPLPLGKDKAQAASARGAAP
ncbi:efflux RND transporter periplasmic adaptor subunit [Stigmatella aurantiaca]|uniref:Secretion family protein HlyD n=1 Tax=Stigmatella aurantiaca (strain DW4/3-1) TaxID=378806 RepID=Q093R3_STIAD|nr:efflux RND transporter periplasmic adaptor subunit [Stigmatella aurantiaca]ADO71066.1 Secretion family protein HlyD [Stigmatella aurantiaca DW4/3-1]EAU66985.1 secretion protein HlyD [Stigmatella aurantiaca DW4/3-1]